MKFTILKFSGIITTGNIEGHTASLVGKRQCRIFHGDKLLPEAIGGFYGRGDQHSVRFGCSEAKLDRIESGPIPNTAALVIIDHPNEVTIIASTQDGPLNQAQLDLVRESQMLHATA